MNDQVEIRPVRGIPEFQACIELQKQTWGDRFTELVPLAMLMAAQRVGGVVAGAFDGDGSLKGFVFGISGWEAGRPVHWSDMLAVRPEFQGRGLGERLKRFQRDILLRQGVRTVYWTFDPLEAKNAYLNLSRLGVVAAEYYVNYYAETGSPVHGGIGTDRLLAVWEIAGDRARRRLDDGEPAAIGDEMAESPVVNPVRAGGGWPRSEEPRLGLDAPFLRIAVPSHIQPLKADDLGLAIEWRERTRLAFTSYLERGYTVREFLRGEAWGAYVLERSALAR